MELQNLPQHIAFIMDGNGRWAQGRGLIRLEGHRRGANTVQTIIEACAELEIPYMTLWAFSTKNWKRSESEVSGLFNLMREFFRKKLEELNKQGVKIRFIGDRSPEGGLPEDIRDIIAQVEEQTERNQKITVAIALNYSGRSELLRAMKRWEADLKNSKNLELSEDLFPQYLDTAGMPDPDLIIRTGGEQRLSDFLPWQTGDAELMFPEEYWPNFTKKELHKCLEAFGKRERRFGGVTTQKNDS
ncbi:MAG: polyprenyl diphosphate synthase [Alphaproteobacteria bacterium]|nr:polyprenyl diphosphate synthase [Alphaproteobacteria bacterium]